MMKTLVFAPHPDDELLGCGGLMAKLARGGAEVGVVYLTSGDAGSLALEAAALTALREEEARQGAAVLGVDDLVFLRNPDGFLAYTPENLNSVVKIIREKRPRLVLVCHGREGHPDHRVAHELVVEAVRRAAGDWFLGCGRSPWRVAQLFCYEVLTPLPEVSYAADITDVMELKLTALRKHASQMQAASYHEAVSGLNRYRAVMLGVGRYCECYQVVKTEIFPAIDGWSAPPRDS